jgi:hypothetical protein
MVRFTSKPLLAVFERPFAILRPSRDVFCADRYCAVPVPDVTSFTLRTREEKQEE